MRDLKHKIILAIVFGVLVAIGAYAAWYSYAREAKLAQVEQCNYDLEHPKPPTMVTAPDGSLAPLYSIETCVAVVVPPRLLDLVRGRMVFKYIPERLTVNQYTILDALLGNYTLGPDITSPCDQSATTTDCSTW